MLRNNIKLKFAAIFILIEFLVACSNDNSNSRIIKTPKELTKIVFTVIINNDEKSFSQLIVTLQDSAHMAEKYKKFAELNKGVDVRREIAKMKNASKLARVQKRIFTSFQSLIKEMSKNDFRLKTAQFVKETKVRISPYKGINIYKMSFIVSTKQKNYDVSLKAVKTARGFVLFSFRYFPQI